MCEGFEGEVFPYTDFWNAPKPRSASYTWRSIFFGRELLLQGVQWGIGNGKSVKIMSDHWIPERPPYMLKPLESIPSTATVHCLIDEEDGSWVQETVSAFFDKETADLILQVPISRHGGDDFVRWPHTKDGIYSVRSAYNMARADKFFVAQSKRGRGSSSSASSNEKY
jgi:hypothetical protein